LLAVHLADQVLQLLRLLHLSRRQARHGLAVEVWRCWQRRGEAKRGPAQAVRNSPRRSC
jgi:hypothetical protein